MRSPIADRRMRSPIWEPLTLVHYVSGAAQGPVNHVGSEAAPGTV